MYSQSPRNKVGIFRGIIYALNPASQCPKNEDSRRKSVQSFHFPPKRFKFSPTNIKILQHVLPKSPVRVLLNSQVRNQTAAHIPWPAGQGRCFPGNGDRRRNSSTHLRRRRRMTTGLERRRRTKPIIWFASCVCAILAVAVTIGGAAVISVYVANRPKIPHLQVTGGHLDRLSYDQKGILDLALQLSVSAVNSNGKAHAVISQVDLRLSFAAAPLAVLAADAFEIGKNSSRVLNYEVETAAAPLDAAAMEKMDLALKNGRVEFGLVGRARTRWHIGPVVSVKFWTHLDCTLPFFYPGGDPAADLRRCISKSH